MEITIPLYLKEQGLEVEETKTFCKGGVMKHKALANMMFAGVLVLIFFAGEVGAQEERLAWDTTYTHVIIGDTFVDTFPTRPTVPPVIDDLGNVYVTGSWGRVYTVKYGPNGSKLWNASCGGWDTIPVALAVDASGNVYVADSEYVTTKYDTDGNELWVATYDCDSCSGRSMTVDGDGNVYVTGYAEYNINQSTYYSDSITVKYDTDGNELWVATYDVGDSEKAYHVGVDASSNVYVTGKGDYPEADPDGSKYVTIKYDTNGNELWVAAYSNDEYFSSPTPGDQTVDASGNVYVAGSFVHFGSPGNPPQISITLKYDTDGNELWVAEYSPGFDHHGPKSMAVDTSENVYVTGSSYADEYATVKYDKDGNELWVALYKGIENDGSPAPSQVNSIAVDDSGNVYVAGSHRLDSFHFYFLSYPYSSYQYTLATVKYDPEGNQVWIGGDIRSWTGGSHLQSYVSVDTAGDVYLAAKQGGPTWFTSAQSKCLTMKYTTNPPDPVCGTYPVPGPAAAYFLPFLLVPAYLLISLGILRRKRL